MKGIFIILITWAISCGPDRNQYTGEVGPPVLPDRKLHAALVVVDGVYNTELIAPMDVFQHTVFHTGQGIYVSVVAPTRDTVVTFEGLRLIPDFSFADSLPPIDILVVPSARNSMSDDLNNQALISFVSERSRQALYTVSLCDGAFVLAQAGILHGMACTTFPADVAALAQRFPSLSVHREVSFVHDRHVITSVGGARSYDAALYLVELLYGRETAVKIGKGLVIDWDLASVNAYRTAR
ncbi:MAG: DJ-1/PfpI family protein [Cyclobacteriaceae bacterium]|jgi:transcriptional regulator GlxA family with amidase domain|nr:DJ-1/PfpI family protein [Cyclobacteriaceae bacterium]